MTNEKILKEIIDSFFKGEDFFEEPGMGIWVAKHGLKEIDFSNITNVSQDLVMPIAIKRSEKNLNNYLYSEFETLTIEPQEGGQYEIAVRIWSEDKWRGYKINDFDSKHYLVGINTRGH